jgi:lipopolysaccharide export system protein LptA
MPLPERFRSLGILALPVLLAALAAGSAMVRIGPAAAEPPAAAASPPPPPPPGQETGMISIESDSQQADNKTGVVTATGNVRIVYPDRGMVATSRQAQYYSREGRLVLSGDVDVIDHEGQRIRAEKLVYRVDSERLRADPPSGQQVYSQLRLQTRPPAATPTPTP